MTEDPIKRRADGLSVGDRILAAYLPAVGDEPAEVVFAKPYTYVGDPWIFVAFQLPNGLIEGTHYKADNGVEVYPAPDPTGLLHSRADEATDPQVDETEVRCASSAPHGPHRTTFAPEMGIPNGICPGRCTQVCIDMAVDGAPQDARKGWHDDDCPAVMDIADVR